MKMICLLALVLGYAGTMAAAGAAEGPVYEMRTYVAAEGRLPDLMKRFRDHTCRLFEKHGIGNVGYWTPLEGEPGAGTTLIYVLKHASREAATASYAALGADAEWQAAVAASEANGKLLAQAPASVFLETTGYSPEVKLEPGERVFELRTYTTAPGKLEALHARFQAHTMGLFTKHGMTHLWYWVPMAGEAGHENTLIYILAHPSREAGLEAFGAFRKDPVWVAAKGESEKDGSLTVPQPEGVRSVYMEAVDFSPLK